MQILHQYITKELGVFGVDEGLHMSVNSLGNSPEGGMPVHNATSPAVRSDGQLRRRAAILDAARAELTKHGYDHMSIAERGDPQVAEEFMPIIHLVFSNLKTWLRGIHHGVSPQHLQAYLNEFTFRFNRRFYPFNAFRSLLGIAGDVTALTYTELYAAKSRPTTSSRSGS